MLFVCENNLYATEMAFVDTTRNPQVANRAEAYGLPGITIDGNDVAAVYAAAGEAITRARQGGGPNPHRVQDLPHPAHTPKECGDGGYRSAEEIDAWKKRDPISALAHRLLDAGHARQEDLDVISGGQHRTNRGGFAICP